MIDISDFNVAALPMRFFEEISKIPRGSGNTDGIADYLEGFAKARGLSYYRDEANNVIIRKSASRGYEERPTVIIQGHTDIVAEKAQNVNIDMQKEGVRVYRDGDFLRARGTTLGADDGVAVAYALSILDSADIEHPAIEALFTSDEETGLIGATALDPSLISGRIMINIDSDDEGVFIAGCAGGVRVDISLPVKREDPRGKAYRLSVFGLLGGHSGSEIGKGRKNAIKVLSELLGSIDGIRLVSLAGGNADNAIPREAEAEFYADNISLEKMKELFVRLTKGETSADFTLMECEGGSALDLGSTKKVISLIGGEPHGVHAMSADICSLVETSSNVGVARLGENTFELTVSIRSSKDKEKDRLASEVTSIAEELGATVSQRGSYPGWEYKNESPLRECLCETFKKMYGKEPRVVAIHAGLECGIFAGKLEGLDCVSIGPDNFDIHTPKEHLSIPSFARVYEFLLEALKTI